MEKRVLYLSILLLIICAGSAFALGTTRYVATTGADTTDCSDNLNPCLTIQYAIGQAADGDTINVATGTYTENLAINKGVTLQGAGRDITTVTGAQTVTANNVVVDGFKLNGGITINDAANQISGGTISNNLITGAQYGIRVGDGTTGHGVDHITIKNNKITGNTKKGILFYNAGDYAAQHISYITISANEISNNGDSGISTYGPGPNTIIDNTVSGNTGNGISIKYDDGDVISENIVTGNAAMGINMHQVTNTIVENNIVSGHVSTGVVTTFWGNPITAGKGSAIYIHEVSEGNTIRLNNLKDNKIGILVSKESNNVGPSSNSINNNNIIGNTEYGILNALVSPSTPVDAEYNWWGAASGPTHASNPGGAGDAVTDNVDFTPWSNVAAPNYDTIMSKLNQLETKVDTLQATLDDSSFGLKEIKNEIIWIVNKVTRLFNFFGITASNDFCEVQDECGVVQNTKCDDGKDNEGDGACDFTGCNGLPKDFSCDSALDDDESSPEAMCQDGADNDGDGYTDYPDDPSCTSSQDNSESTECNDGVDNDNDGKIDFTNDPGCADANDNSEIGQCQDGNDNDQDGATDFPADFSCDSLADNDESLPIAYCQDGVDGADPEDTDADYPADWGCDSLQDNSEFNDGITQCSDGIDNDGDGVLDQHDPECADRNDNSEASECNDLLDNDQDGLTDLVDPGCVDAHDNSEIGQCQDGIDNDGDGAIDLVDFACSNAADNDEGDTLAQCQNTNDDDSDTFTDFPADWGCDSKQDNDETLTGATQCSDGIDNDNDQKTDQADPDCTDKNDDDESTPPIPVIFRTSAVGGSYTSSTWIAYDYNGDGNLEGKRGGLTKVLGTKPCPPCILTDYYGRCWLNKDGIYYMEYNTAGNYCIFREYKTDDTGAVTASAPTAPYTANHQEVLGP